MSLISCTKNINVIKFLKNEKSFTTELIFSAKISKSQNKTVNSFKSVAIASAPQNRREIME